MAETNIKKYLGEEALNALISNIKTKLVELQSNITTSLDGKADSTHYHAVVTNTSDGYMSAADKIKLDGIDPSLYINTIDLIVDENEDAMITCDSNILPSQGVEF